MKVSIKAKINLGLTEVPEQLAKEIQEKIGKLESDVMNLKVKVEEDETET